MNVAGVALQRSEVVAVGVVGDVEESDDGGATRAARHRRHVTGASTMRYDL